VINLGELIEMAKHHSSFPSIGSEMSNMNDRIEQTRHLGFRPKFFSEGPSGTHSSRRENLIEEEQKSKDISGNRNQFAERYEPVAESEGECTCP